MSRIRQAVPIVLASIALGGIAVLYLRPEWVLTAIPELDTVVTNIDPLVFLLGAIAMIAVATGAMILRGILLASSRTVETSAERTESSQSLFVGAGATRGQLGASFDALFETATDYGLTDRTDRETARTQTVDELRSLAVDTYQQATGCDTETARAAIEGGEWTTDRRAAGLLAANSGPSIPLRLWAWDLLFGRDPYVNSVDHTLAALETIADSGLGEEAV